MITFGRTNPSKMFDSIVKLNYSNKDNSQDIDEKDISFETIKPIDDETKQGLSRFRHAACATFDSKLFIYGGKFFDETSNSSVTLNDAYLIDKFNCLKKITVNY